MIKKTKLMMIGVCFFGSLNCAYAFNLGNIFQDIWGTLDKGTNGLVGVCYQPDFNIGSFDACSILNSIGDLEVDVCSLAPPIPGFTKKSKEVGLSGLKAFCDAKQRQFENVISKTASDVAENTLEDGRISDKTTLPNGEKVKDYLKKWSVSSIAKKAGSSSVVKTALAEGNQKVLSLIQDYGKSFGAKQIEDVKVADIKAPSDMVAYKEQVAELASSFFENASQTSSSAISSVISAGVADKNPEEAQEYAKNYLNEKKKQFELAKANEIGQKLSVERGLNHLAIPTQEYVELQREDIQLEMIAEIRQQQLKEAQIIAEVTEKWNRREAIAEIIADKEVIMAQKFDEEEELLELEKEMEEITKKATDAIKQEISSIISGIF